MRMTKRTSVGIAISVLIADYIGGILSHCKFKKQVLAENVVRRKKKLKYITNSAPCVTAIET